MRRDPSYGFVKLPLDRLTVIDDDLPGLRAYVLSRAWEHSTAEGFLLVRRFPMGDELADYYPFDAEGFRILAE